MTTDSTDLAIERVADAIEQAQCPDWQGPYGLFDYTSYGHTKPHHVRDFRDPNSDTWGETVFMTTDREEAKAVYKRLTREHVAKAAISALSQVEGQETVIEECARVAEQAHVDDDRIDRQIRQEIATAIRALSHPAGRKEGWKLMPGEMTTEMLSAASSVSDYNGMLATNDDLEEMYRAIFRAAPCALDPAGRKEGWRPNEPTDAMILAGEEAFISQYEAHPEWDEPKHVVENIDVVAIYRAMIAAAPSPEKDAASKGEGE